MKLYFIRQLVSIFDFTKPVDSKSRDFQYQLIVTVRSGKGKTQKSEVTIDNSLIITNIDRCSPNRTGTYNFKCQFSTDISIVEEITTK
uniref:Uncharacterized protein n=1 Tax=Wuchereria bancrofti TaxID=6293 RepID=A0AAF5RWU0_WUCBA